MNWSWPLTRYCGEVSENRETFGKALAGSLKASCTDVFSPITVLFGYLLTVIYHSRNLSILKILLDILSQNHVALFRYLENFRPDHMCTNGCLSFLHEYTFSRDC